MIKYFFLGLMLVGVACNDNPTTDETGANTTVNSVDKIRTSAQISNSSLVNNPVSADTPADLSQMAKMEFEQETFDMGKMKEGEEISQSFKFKNTGKSPLVISDAKGSCGCTVPEWPRAPIAPGESGEIRFKFNSKGKSGLQDKTITIVANTNPNQTVLHIKGEVLSDTPAATN
jgi:hypothetical protein